MNKYASLFNSDEILGEKRMRVRDFLAISFMIFAFFFGAGNMIFPPFVGLVTSDSFLFAYFGYILIDVGLSLVAIIAISSLGRASSLTGDLPKFVGGAFLIIIYIIIGPLFGVPRTSVVAYEMGILPFFSSSNMLFVYTLIFFGLTFVLSVAPGRLVNFVGGYMTPLLLLFLLCLFAIAIVQPTPTTLPLAADLKAYGPKEAFIYGLIRGYLTMDTLAAIVFGAVIYEAVTQATKNKNRREKSRAMVSTSVLAGGLLALTYLGLFYIGISGEFAAHASNGGQVLSFFVTKHLGSSGAVLLAIIIILACLTTAVGLISSCAKYFHFLCPKISYRNFVFILVMSSLVLANLGLNTIIELSIPVVVALYPVVIVMVVISLLRRIVHIHRACALMTMMVLLTFGLCDAMHIVFYNFSAQYLVPYIPLLSDQLSWLIPGLVFLSLSLVIGCIMPAKTKERVHE